jgi:opacity protein-like surface antigen
MKFARFVITVAVVGLSGSAFAQGTIGQQIATTPSVHQAVANTPAAQAATSTSSDPARGWVVSGFLGANFGASRSSNVDLSAIEDLDTNSSTTGINFGGQIAYLARGVIGAEFLMDFSPGLGTFNNLLFSQSPDVNSYMFNLIAVAPFGRAQTVDPYISGGVGAVTLNSSIFVSNPLIINPLITNAIATQDVSGSKFGWDLGGGLMAWSEKNWGFRADLRYYRTTGNDTDVFDINDIGDGTIFSRVQLSGISFWKANAGVAFRF